MHCKPPARREVRALAVAVGGFTLAYSLYGVVRHRHFGSSAYDLGIFDQVVWHLSRFETPASTIRGLSNIFGDHFHPVIALWAPLYWIAPVPETLIVAQAALLAASLVPVFLFVRDRLDRAPSYVLTLAYGLFWGLQQAMAFDVHEVAFSPLVIATAILAVDRRRWGLFWACMVALIAIKEDLIPLVGGFGLLLLVLGERRHGLMAIAGSVAAFLSVVGIVVPAMNQSGGFMYTSTYSAVLEKPWTIPLTLVTPLEKVRTAFLWFVPFLFTSLASPFALLILPLALERFLSAAPNHWGASFHYSAPLAPILAMSAADGLSRMIRIFTPVSPAGVPPRTVLGISLAMFVLCAVLPGRQPLWRAVTPSFYRTTQAHRTGAAALAVIPRNASVLAQAAVVPHLSQRAEIFMLDHEPRDADYVIVAEHLSPWPLVSFDEIAAIVDDELDARYVVVFAHDGWTVLRREP